MKKKSSQKRIEANRRNAQKSTGPRTPEGKAKSAQNAVTHGLSSLSTNPLAPGCFLKLEDESEFQGMLNRYLNERDLQRDLPLANANAHLANGFAHSESMMRLYIRYDAQLHRHYKSCLKQLTDLQTNRRLEPEPPNEPNEPQADPPSTEAPNEAIEPVRRPHRRITNRPQTPPQNRCPALRGVPRTPRRAPHWFTAPTISGRASFPARRPSASPSGPLAIPLPSCRRSAPSGSILWWPCARSSMIAS